MQTRNCQNCHQVFQRIAQCKDQRYCGNKQCQRARKRNWERMKKDTDPDYRKNRKESQKSWQNSNKDYWNKYRLNNPLQAERNRQLQRIRNAKRRGHLLEPAQPQPTGTPAKEVLSFVSTSKHLIAKTDASKPYQLCLLDMSNPFLIAKTDASNSSPAKILQVYCQLPLIAKTDA